MQEHPWHQLWTRSLDAATGITGSAESMSNLPAQWWHHSMEASKAWWTWWFATFSPLAQPPIVPGVVRPPSGPDAPPYPEAPADEGQEAQAPPAPRPRAGARHERKR